MNTFGYVGQSPLGWIDPTGLLTDSVTATCAKDPVLCAILGGSAALAVVPDPNTEGAETTDEETKDRECPSLPDTLVGDQSDPRAGPNKGVKKHTSGPLLPEYGGTGDFETDLETLAGSVRPWEKGDSAPPGSLVGENGIFGRPTNSSGGSSIDIPANGGKIHETLHY